MRQPDNSGLVILLDDGSTIEFDVIITVTHTLDVESANYPVELDGDRVYRVNPLPVILSVDARVASIDLADEAAGDDRDLIAWDRLQYIRNRGELFTLQTADADYLDMYVTSLERIEDVGTTETLAVTIEFQQGRLGMLEEVEVPAQYVSQPSGARRGSQQTTRTFSNPEDLTPEEFKAEAQEKFTVLRFMG